MKLSNLIQLALNTLHFPVVRKTIGKVIRGKKIVIDSRSFINCRVVDCEIIYLGIGRVHLDGCDFYGCSFAFDGPAANSLALLKALDGLVPGLMRDTFNHAGENK